MANPGQMGKVPTYLDALKTLMRAIAEAKMATGANQQLLAQIEAMVLGDAQQQAQLAMQPQMPGAGMGGQPPGAGAPGGAGAGGLAQLMGGLMGGIPGAMGGAPGGPPGAGPVGAGGAQVGGLTPAPADLDRMLAGTQ